MTVSFDSNLFVYAADSSAGPRHGRALIMVERALQARRGILILQTLAEFFAVVTRKLGTRPEEARRYLAGLRAALPVQPASEPDLDAAMLAVQDHGLSFWDAMLWATAERVGVRYLLTEDFQNRRVLGRVTFVDPFDPANADLLERELPPTS
jgi:predicted nucleic acid-binding protein